MSTLSSLRLGRLRRSGPALSLPVMLALAVGCERTPVKQAPRDWPAGTVLALNGAPITQEEVDEVAGWYALLEPQFTLPHLRRLALSNVVLPKFAARTAEPERRRAAEADARAALTTCRAGAPPSEPAVRKSEGNWREVEVGIWAVAINTPVGSWSELIETPGCFHVARLDELKSGRTPRDTTVVLTVLDFPYLDVTLGRQAVDQAIDRSQLVFVDETWRDVVPTAWQYRMRGETP